MRPTVLLFIAMVMVLIMAGGVALAKTITGTNAPNTLIGATSADRISGLRGGDYIDGMQGDDTLYGGRGNDKILGKGGKDRIAGGLHSDALLGGSANDTIRAADGYADPVDCGPGTSDTAYIDVTLDTSENCENVNPSRSTGPPRSTGRTTGDPVVVAAGDIASCASKGDEATAKLLARIGGTVLTLGDNAYEDGTAADFRECYNPSWGKHKERTKPAPGNHDYETKGASGYFGYFGKAAGDRGKGYYSYNLGSWHLLSLNSNCAEVGHCNSSSQQMRWLKANLAANRNKRCTLAYFHHPRFSSGKEHGSTTEVKPLWDVLYAAGVDVVLSGHEHNYERFAPQDPSGRADPKRGIREFVVGTGGGGSHYPISEPIAHSKTHNDHTYGVLKLTLHPKGYNWRFVPAERRASTDSGSAQCH